MAKSNDFDLFRTKIAGLVNGFKAAYPEIIDQGMDEASLRLSYLDRFFEALGWDVRNEHNAPLHAREVVVEPPSKIQGGRKRPDYLFRIEGLDKFICEAKRPRSNIDTHFFQVQNYVYNLRLWVGVLSDFEYLIIFVVGGQPKKERPFDPVPGWRLHYTQFANNAQQIWDLLSKQQVENGSLEQFIQNLPKVTRRGRQGWLLKPDRSKAVDSEFLIYLDTQRRHLAKWVHDKNAVLGNGQARYWSERDLNGAVQLIIDRILFQRICEDRGIDVGTPLKEIHDDWERNGRIENQLWPMFVANFRYLSRVFNGGIFGKPGSKPHEIDSFNIADRWLSDFAEELTADDSKYLFSIMPVEILGSVYERFLGFVVQPDGRVEQKPEVRKAGGVFYTPRYVVDFIVNHTLAELLPGKSPTEVSGLTVLDPTCGSGSFLLRAFEKICEHHVEWFLQHPKEQAENLCYKDAIGNLRLTTGLKRNILVNNIFGVDIDPQAVEVTQMSLYLKILEDETRETLDKDHRLFPKETFLPDLSKNIKCGNAFVEPDIGDLNIDELKQIKPFWWTKEFPAAKKGFDAVIGNPPYGAELSDKVRRYAIKKFNLGTTDTAALIIANSRRLTKKRGRHGFIVPKPLTYASNWKKVRQIILPELKLIADCGKVWDKVKLEQCIFTSVVKTERHDYESRRRINDKFSSLGKIPIKDCAKFKMILNGVGPGALEIADAMKKSGIFLGDVTTNRRGAGFQSSQKTKGKWSIIGGKQIESFGTREPRGKLPQTMAIPDNAKIKAGNILVQNIIAHTTKPTDRIKLIACLAEKRLAINAVILDTVNQIGSEDKRYPSAFLLGVLLSDAVAWYVYRFIYGSAIRTMHFDKPVTNRIPLPKPPRVAVDKKRVEDIINEVNYLQKLRREIRRGDHAGRVSVDKAILNGLSKINRKVFDLYGLSRIQEELIRKDVHGDVE